MRRSVTRTFLAVVLAGLVTIPFWACSLNPQPIPPGAEPDGSFGGSSPPVDGITSDAGQSPRSMDASDVSVPPSEEDGGDSGDAAAADARDD